jgi:type 1 glutamine amidotransferase
MPERRKALIVWGGWEGHEPEQVARLFEEILAESGFESDIQTGLSALESKLTAIDLIVPVWTMGEITPAQAKSVCSAVESGVGIAGCHGGMCDSFRSCTEWQFLTGGQWVAHPGDDGVRYTVRPAQPTHPILQGIGEFDVVSEQYYMHVDPANDVLATTTFGSAAPGPHTANGDIEMPVIWTKRYGEGKVFYCSLGHQRKVLEAKPVRTIMRRGFEWAARVPAAVQVG